MKIALLLSFVSMAAAFVSMAAAFTDLPSDPAFYDSFLNNSTAIKLYFGCILDDNPCDDFGSHSKKHLADALKNKHVECKECDRVQKHISHILDQLVHQEEYRPYLDEFRAKYDPEGKYIAELEESVKDY